MLTKNNVRLGKALHHAVVHHALCPTADLFARLEYQQDGSRPLIAMAGKNLCRAKQPGHMQIVSATMGYAGFNAILVLCDGRTCVRQAGGLRHRSEEHTSELQSLMRISYAVF